MDSVSGGIYPMLTSSGQFGDSASDTPGLGSSRPWSISLGIRHDIQAEEMRALIAVAYSGGPHNNSEKPR
jgi:hypothetical protein